MPRPNTSSPPRSILLVGSGVFGLSTAATLAADPFYEHTSITVVDRSTFPAADGASIDYSRYIRADYPQPLYASLALKALETWRTLPEGIFHNTGLHLSAPASSDAYLRRSLANIRALSPDALSGVEMKEEGQGGRYTNAEAGWVDARGAMEWLRERVEGTGRVKFVVGRVVRLAFAGDTVRGAQLESGDILEADVTILAAGAWSPSLLDLADRVRASGQVLAYIAVEGAEREEVVRKGCVMDVGSWIFSTPPPPSGPGFLKIGRHGHGYTNPTTIPHPESPSQTLSVSLPHTSPHTPHASTPIPAEAHHELRAFLAQAYPSLADRKWSFTRLCWYADTPTGDFLVDWHPRYAGLFVATGGSGHGFKFLPVLGRAVVDCMRGEGGEVGEVWRWREEAVPGVWEHEGERGGVSGMVLGEEMG